MRCGVQVCIRSQCNNYDVLSEIRHLQHTQGSSWVWARPLRDDVTLQRRPSLAEPIPKMIHACRSLWIVLFTHFHTVYPFVIER